MTNNWLKHGARRLKSRWLLKGLVISSAITLFMIAYFSLLRHPFFPVTTIPITWIDRLIDFTPWALVPYASLWLYISLAPALLERGEQLAYAFSAIALAMTGLLIFLFFPTTVPRLAIDWNLYPSVAFLKSLDAAGNACPSMHVAFAVFTGPWLHYLLKRMGAPAALRLANLAWCGLIVWSTLAIKQHLAIDAEAGALAGLFAAAPGLIVVARQREPAEWLLPGTKRGQ